MDLSSLFGGTSGQGGSVPTGMGSGQRPEMYFGQTPVYGTTAVNSPANTALGVAGGTPNQNNSMPAGATLAPPKMQNSASGGGSVGGQLSDSLKAIGDMIANYKMAGAYGNSEVAAQAPNMTISPALASFSVPSIARRV